MIIAAASLLFVSCRQYEDTRVFSPMVEFVGTEYVAAAEGEGVDLSLRLSHPAQLDFSVGISISGDLVEGRQFLVETHEIPVAKGQESIRTHISFVEDEIWSEESSLRVAILPGLRYTVDPNGNCMATVKVTRAQTLPVISVICLEESHVTNPFLAETLRFALETRIAPREDISVDIVFGDLVAGRDFLVNGSEDGCVALAAGQTGAEFEIGIRRIDESGIDRSLEVGVRTRPGVYVAAEGNPCMIRLFDPAVDFGPIQKTAALNNGAGHQLRQAIRSADGTWNGNTAADFLVPQAGSNYLSSNRNLMDSQWLCKIVSPGSNALRLTDLFPDFAYPNEYTIADYAAASNARNFSACDSLFRFVLDEGSQKQGRIMLGKPCEFVCGIARRSEWEEGTNPYKAWQDDSRATKGDIGASASPLIVGKVKVTVEKIEGRFDFTKSDEAMIFSVWFSSDSPHFMHGVNLETLAAVKDGDCWRVDYKLWPR